jgi:hypothetical protein
MRPRALMKLVYRRCASPTARPRPSNVFGVRTRWTWLGMIQYAQT